MRAAYKRRFTGSAWRYVLTAGEVKQNPIGVGEKQTVPFWVAARLQTPESDV